jgi:hypothetical protein
MSSTALNFGVFELLACMGIGTVLSVAVIGFLVIRRKSN